MSHPSCREDGCEFRELPLIMPPSKVCPQCNAVVPIRLKVCKSCQHVFRANVKSVIKAKSDVGSEGSAHVCVCVCLSMLQLTPLLFVRPANDTIYFTGNDNQFNLAVFSEYAPLQRFERCQHSIYAYK